MRREPIPTAFAIVSRSRRGRPLTGGVQMTDPTAEFFDDLAQRGHEPLLANASGRMRFDIADGKKTETWFVTIVKGDLTVSRSGGAADSTLVSSRALFDRLASGKA